ncbi:hypothetical protein Tco_0941412 [Tanacetum coccineum]|uniref:Uncharacterized protein n=1 Tax=Tanacetum coccineum TaxID=301880 RepID=A0ABQ5DQY0_9ASTR
MLDESIAKGDVNLDKVLKKQDHGNDEDEDPSAGPNQGKKTKKIRTKESESSNKSSTLKETSKCNTPPKPSSSHKSINAEDTDQPQDDPVTKTDNAPKDNWFKESPTSLTPDPKWNQDRIVGDQPEQTWFNDLVSAKKGPLTFDELMATPIDFSKFAMNRLKIDKLTKADLVGLVYNLLKGTCQSSIQLEYNMEECHLGHLTVAAEYFFNNDLEYLKSRDSERKYTTSITKTKAARYELVGIKDMIPKQWSVTKVGYNKDDERGIKHWGPKRQLFYGSQLNRFSKHDVYSPLKILSVVSVKVNKLYGYGYLEEIMMRIVDRQLYKFKQGDFVNLHLNDIEDMLLLVVQHKLFHLDSDVIIDLVMALRMFARSLIIKNRVEDVQLGVESYQKKLNITKPQKDFPIISAKEPYTPSFDP